VRSSSSYRTHTSHPPFHTPYRHFFARWTPYAHRPLMGNNTPACPLPANSPRFQDNSNHTSFPGDDGFSRVPLRSSLWHTTLANDIHTVRPNTYELLESLVMQLHGCQLLPQRRIGVPRRAPGCDSAAPCSELATMASRSSRLGVDSVIVWID